MRFAAKLLLLDVIQGHAYDCLLELLRLHSQCLGKGTDLRGDRDTGLKLVASPLGNS